MRVGIGYDIHRFEEGRRLVLGGVEIPRETGLAGVSDGDVLLHAIMDALLGAAGLADIGHHFPPDDPQWKDVSSYELLLFVRGIIVERFVVENVDATIIAERPPLAAHRTAMRQRIADALLVDVRRANVKMTTHEGLGAIGRGEGIAAMAVVMLADDNRERTESE